MHNCALKSDQTVWCWGYASEGQLGDGTTGHFPPGARLHPVQVLNGDGNGPLTDVASIDGGSNHTCAVKTDGTAWCWGWDQMGQDGDNTAGAGGQHIRTLPVQVVTAAGPALTNVTQISAGDFASCAVTTDQSVWCWGGDDQGQLGDGDPNNFGDVKAAVQVQTQSGTLTNVMSVSAGFGHYACALRSDGTVWCWGRDGEGELGDGTTGDSSSMRSKAVEVMSGADPRANIKSISAGSQHMCAVTYDKTAWCWGNDGSAQLGDAAFGIQLEPVQVMKGSSALSGVRQIAAGLAHTCALRTTGHVLCWGSDKQGQIGDGTRGDANHVRMTPTPVLF
jgi:alpha-tubulin suppressor-like RCC1 family protein